MTSDDYRACIKSFGLTPCKPSFLGSTLHQSRDGLFHQVPDPEGYTDEERDELIALVKLRIGIIDN